MNYRTITQIPPVAPCHVSLRLPQKPATVQLQPQNAPLDRWRYEGGRVEVEIPKFDVHQMVVMKLGE